MKGNYNELYRCTNYVFWDVSSFTILWDLWLYGFIAVLVLVLRYVAAVVAPSVCSVLVYASGGFCFHLG
jgi:hypothetical protein